MKRVVIVFSALVAAGLLQAQCPGCIPVNCAAQNQDGGLCDSVVTGMANHPLDEQVSFYMPAVVYNAQAPGGYVRLRRIKITGVTGLPLGVNWESNHSPANEYFPQSGDSLGCVRLCGTPLQAGTFPLTIYLQADVTVISLNLDVNNQAETYSNAVVEILPDTSGGATSFTITPNITRSCEALTLTFEAQITSPVNPVTYAWDFGNGNTATGITPGSQTYSEAGQYPVSLTTTIREYVIRRVRVVQLNSNWCGDIEEPNIISCIGSPDLYFTIPELGYTSSEKANTGIPASWTNLSLHVPIGTPQVELRFYDKDNGPPLGSQDDTLGSAVINIVSGTFLWTDRWGTVTNGDIIIDDTIGTVFTDTLNIEIGVKPVAILTASAGDSICSGDSTILVLSGTDISRFTWFKDSVFIADAHDTFFTAKEAGTYWIDVASLSGCTSATDPLTISVFAVPPEPAFYFNTQTRLIYTNNHMGVAHIQWYLNGQAIPGATSSQFIVTDTGYYQVEYSNVLGCSIMSGERYIGSIVPTSVNGREEIVDLQIFPNPANGRMQVQLTLTEKEGRLIIMDFSGKEVFRQEVASGTAAYIGEIDLTHRAAGVYSIRFVSGESQLVKKIVLFH